MILTRTLDLNSGESKGKPKNVSLHNTVIIALLIRLWWKFSAILKPQMNRFVEVCHDSCFFFFSFYFCNFISCDRATENIKITTKLLMFLGEAVI